MQLRIVASSLVFMLLGTGMAGAQAQQSNPQQPAEQATVKNANAQSARGHRQKASHHARSKRAETSSKAKRRAYRPEYTRNSVEVINGSTTQKVVFNDEQKPSESAQNGPSQLKVEVVNGNSTDTRYFYMDKNQPEQQHVATRQKQPVVVGIQSSDTRFIGGNKHPVVTAITQVGPSDATSANSGGQKLTTGVAPQPKRAPYQAEPH